MPTAPPEPDVVVAGLLPDVSEPGMFAALVSAGVAVLVVRGEDGELRAFSNTCRHDDPFVAAERAAPGQRAAGAFTCPFADWPDAHADGGSAVRPLTVATAHGVVFVRPAGDGPISTDTLVDAPTATALDALALERYERTGATREVDARNPARVTTGFLEATGALPIGTRAALAVDTAVDTGAGAELALFRAFPLTRGGTVVDVQRYALTA